MRILHTEASTGWGGQEIRILTEARTFRAHGHEVHLLANEGSNILAAAERFGVPATAAELHGKSLAAVRGMRRFMGAWRPDIVNVHSSVDHWTAALARIALSPRPSIVRTRHISTPVPRNFASRWVYNKGCDLIATTSEDIADRLSSDGFVPRSKARSIPTGIDLDRYRPAAVSAEERIARRRALGLPGEGFLFGIVATLRSWKGHAHLIDAFARLGQAGAHHVAAHLVIVGDGPQTDNIERQLGSLDLAGRVTMGGRQEDVVPYLQVLDAFVLPSYANEGVPQAVLQAMACELPIVSCPIGGIPEATGGLPAVRLVPPKDPQALAGAMETVMAAPPPPEARAALRHRVASLYSEEAMYSKMLDLFTQAAAGEQERLAGDRLYSGGPSR